MFKNLWTYAAIFFFLLGLAVLLAGAHFFKDTSRQISSIEDLYFHGVFGERPFLLVDIRSKSEYVEGHILNSFSDEGCETLERLPWLIHKPTVIILDESSDSKMLGRCDAKYLNYIQYRNAVQDWKNQGFPLQSGELNYYNFQKGCGALGRRAEECI